MKHCVQIETFLKDESRSVRTRAHSTSKINNSRNLLRNMWKDKGGRSGDWERGEALLVTDQIPNLFNFLKVLSQFLHRELNTTIFAYFSFKLDWMPSQ